MTIISQVCQSGRQLMSGWFRPGEMTLCPTTHNRLDTGLYCSLNTVRGDGWDDTGWGENSPNNPPRALHRKSSQPQRVTLNHPRLTFINFVNITLLSYCFNPAGTVCEIFLNLGQECKILKKCCQKASDNF